MHGKIGIEVFFGVLASLITLFISLINYHKTNDEFFKELFTEFNVRYNEMNDILDHIKGTEILNDAQRTTIIDYLNLCAEEYMWVRKGRIPFHIWKSWMNGMRLHFEKPCIKEIVEKESRFWKSSYYGFLETVFIQQIIR